MVPMPRETKIAAPSVPVEPVHIGREKSRDIQILTQNFHPDLPAVGVARRW